jgi:peptide/nickel transport system substrate-binding protein
MASSPQLPHKDHGHARRAGRLVARMAASRCWPRQRHAWRARRRGAGPARQPRRLRVTVAAACGCSLLLAACATATAPVSGAGRPLPGGVASYALGVGEDFSWLFPLPNEVNYEAWDGNPDGEMWLPLYRAGGPGITGIDYPLSLASKPVYSDHDQTVTVTMKRNYRWSDGQPVTVSDVQFFFQLEAAGVKLGKYAPYVPGDMPDDITSVTYHGPYQFTLHLNHPYNPVWFTGNQLTWIYPLPRQVWDKTCARCPVGNNAATLAGAEKVYNFLYAQSSELATYSTNPIWKTVDGPWVISSFDPVTYHAVFRANKKYTGPDRPHLDGYQIYSFSSDVAELDALRSGRITFGWLPISDARAARTFEAMGFTFKPWYAIDNEVMEFGYTSKQWGPLVRQLYIRQALQHLVNQQLYIKATLHGYGVPDYGIVPAVFSPYVSPQLRRNPYPYSVTAAVKLLAAHGWVKNPAGVDVCQRPGVASGDCGAGIARGRPLSLRFMFSTGSPEFLAQVEAYQAAAKAAGIQITLDPQTENTMFSVAGVCPPGPCNWGIAGYSGYMWPFGQYHVVPAGGQEFGKGNYWAGGYYSPTAQALINAAHTQAGFGPLYRDENYLTQQVAGLWWPLPAIMLLLVKNTLRGWTPLDPYDADPLPFRWYFVK